VRPPCKTCGHSPYWHRFDDDKLTLTHTVTSPDAEFRCLGEEFAGCDVECQNYVELS
jgi:hypothetical protein